MKLQRVNLLPAFLLLLAAASLPGATITASSSNPKTAAGATAPGTNTWAPSDIGKMGWYSDMFSPKINWSSGADTADGQSYPEAARGEENKFRLVYNST